MEKSSSSNARYLNMVVAAATLGGFLFGFDTAVISGTVRPVKETFGLDNMGEGWFVSSALLGCIAGVAVSGKLGQLLGRKKLMLAAAILFALSAWGCSDAGSASTLIMYRLLGGVGIGFASVVCPMYISELAPSQIRGKLISFYQLAITLGILAAYFSNAIIASGDVNFPLMDHAPWRMMFLAGLIPALFFLIFSFLIPESPRWLAMQGRNDEALRVLASISDKARAELDFREIRASLDTGKGSPFAQFRGKLRQPLFLAVSLAALSQFSGINAIIYYGPSILEKAGFTLGDALGGQVSIGLVNMLLTVVAIVYVDRFGRRPLLLVGIAGCALALLASGLLFLVGITSGWPILFAILVFIACFAFSFGPVVWVVIAEFFPTRVRAEAAAISTMGLWIANWLVGLLFPVLNQWPSLPLFIFALFSAVAFWMVWSKVPETKGQSLEKIESLWT
jgi:SP family arabinose:H+ symporter-like MFS transporter